MTSLASQLSLRPIHERSALIAKLTDSEVDGLLWDWKFWAREKQVAPDWKWLVWLILAGRGFGKTRTGAEQVRVWKNDVPIIHLIGPTASDVRDVMIEGPGGIMSTSPPWDRPHYEPSKRRITWRNGCVGVAFSADEPDRLRGPQCYKAWCDEPASWRFDESWDQMMFGLRLGALPQVIATTTPRPTKLIRDLVSRANLDVALTAGSTYENRDNLAPSFFTTVIRKYEGTRLGRQELDAELLQDVEGALWTRDMIEESRCTPKQVTYMPKIGIGVDPPATDSEDAAECGILVCGIDERSVAPHAFVLNDVSMPNVTPKKWGQAVVNAFHDNLADIVIAEANNGGLMVQQTIHSIDPKVPVKLVWASRGKRTRAEPISAMYEQHRIHHVGVFPRLEDQMCTWVAGEPSPDRMDALVWILTELMIGIAPSVGRLARQSAMVNR